MLYDELPTIETDRGADDEETCEVESEFADGDLISTTLPLNAQTCYEIFCDVERIPEWVASIRSVQTLAFDDGGRPTRAAFLRSFTRASAGYTLDYIYDDKRRMVAWSTPPGMMTQVSGRALFLPLTERATMMHYQLEVSWPAALGLDQGVPGGHPASNALNDFRDYITRRFMFS